MRHEVRHWAIGFHRDGREAGERDANEYAGTKRDLIDELYGAGLRRAS